VGDGVRGTRQRAGTGPDSPQHATNMDPTRHSWVHRRYGQPHPQQVLDVRSISDRGGTPSSRDSVVTSTTAVPLSVPRRAPLVGLMPLDMDRL